MVERLSRNIAIGVETITKENKNNAQLQIQQR
jgi:hypothetical protein